MAVLSLPFSNASVERAFSILNLVKSNLRNRLYVKTVDAILCVRFLLNWKRENCCNFTVTQLMIKLFKVDMYDHKKVDTDVICSDDNEYTGDIMNALNCVESAFTIIDDIELVCVSL